MFCWSEIIHKYLSIFIKIEKILFKKNFEIEIHRSFSYHKLSKSLVNQKPNKFY